MTSPKYFRWFPDIEYALSINKAGKTSKQKIKDYFHLLKVRDDIFREETLYTSYTVTDGMRPDQIAYEYYGDEQYYWVILQINEITDFYNQWPLSENELSVYINDKYGGPAGATAIHHYETVTTYDQDTPANLVLPGGLVVPEDFIFYYPATPGSNVTLSESKPVAVTNRKYERDLNDAKAQISILDKKYIFDYVREVRTYAQNLNPGSSSVNFSGDVRAIY